MVTYNYCLKVSRKNHKIITEYMPIQFKKRFEEYDGRNVTANQILTFLLRKAMRDYDKFNDNGDKCDEHDSPPVHTK